MTQPDLRDELAVERTRLANERTLLAYVRTAMALAAAGAAVLHFYPDSLALLLTAWALVGGGGAALAIGSIRFWKTQRKIGVRPPVH